MTAQSENKATKPIVRDAAYYKRREAMDDARANIGLEDFKTSKKFREYEEQVVNGEITIQEFMDIDPRKHLDE